MFTRGTVIKHPNSNDETFGELNRNHPPYAHLNMSRYALSHWA
jgi:hypothetical protein